MLSEQILLNIQQAQDLSRIFINKISKSSIFYKKIRQFHRRKEALRNFIPIFSIFQHKVTSI